MLLAKVAAVIAAEFMAFVKTFEFIMPFKVMSVTAAVVALELVAIVRRIVMIVAVVFFPSTSTGASS